MFTILKDLFFSVMYRKMVGGIEKVFL